MERDWPLELEPDFGEFEYNRIFRWCDSVIVGIEYNGGGLAEMKRIAAELEGLFGVSSDDLGIFYWSFYDG